MKDYRGFLIDLDGTAYIGNKVIKSTLNFVTRMQVKNKKILFVTNNASISKEKILLKLQNMGYRINLDNIITSANTAAFFLKNIKDKIFVIGSEDLKQELKAQKISIISDLDFTKLKKEEIKKIKYVIVGYTNSLSYSDIAIASLILQNKEAKLYGTNGDLTIPREIGNIPGNGSILNLLEGVTHKKAEIVGKPYKPIVEYALAQINLNKAELCLIGDNYETDIKTGIYNNIDTCFVETGIHNQEYIKKQKEKPTYTLINLDMWEEN